MFLITHSSTYFLFIFMALKWPWQIHDLTSVSFIYKLHMRIQRQATMRSHFVPRRKNTAASFSSSNGYRNLYVYDDCFLFFLNGPGLETRHLLGTNLYFLSEELGSFISAINTENLSNITGKRGKK